MKRPPPHTCDLPIRLGYACPVEMCETQVLLESALLALVNHDLAATYREGLPPSIELRDALLVLIKHCGYTEAAFAPYEP
jgi:hypothetical protein